MIAGWHVRDACAQAVKDPAAAPPWCCCTGRGRRLPPDTLAAALHLGECRAIFEPDPVTGSEVLWLLARDSWAWVCRGKVRQAGARNLWDEAVSAYQWWIECGRPDRQRFHLTVTKERQWVWLDDPANAVSTNAWSAAGRAVNSTRPT